MFKAFFSGQAVHPLPDPLQRTVAAVGSKTKE
nr:MAG TPA: hypothetical protein [Caudoviricetes sp.]